MKTFSQYLEEHPTFRQKVTKKITPLEKTRKQIKTFKSRGGFTGSIKRKLQKQWDKLNPMSPINKMKTLKTKDQIKTMQDKSNDLKYKMKDIQTDIKKLRKSIKK